MTFSSLQLLNCLALFFLELRTSFNTWSESLFKKIYNALRSPDTPSVTDRISVQKSARPYQAIIALLGLQSHWSGRWSSTGAYCIAVNALILLLSARSWLLLFDPKLLFRVEAQFLQGLGTCGLQCWPESLLHCLGSWSGLHVCLFAFRKHGSAPRHQRN